MVSPESLGPGILVLGMHRTGTSATTGVLARLGVHLGAELMPPSEANPLGYYENAQVHRIHEAALALMDSHWAALDVFPKRWWDAPKFADVSGQLQAFVRKEFSASPVWAVKDPRLSRLWPLWRPVFERIDGGPRFIITTRRPDAVARSLAIRDKLDANRSFLLWAMHEAEAVLASRGRPRVILAYERLTADWKGSFSAASTALGVQWPIGVDAARQTMESFIRKSDDGERRRIPGQNGELRRGAYWEIERLHEALHSAHGTRGDGGLDRQARRTLRSVRRHLAVIAPRGMARMAN